ncbi:hypothetical protein ACFQU3_04015 [Terrabacter sp. GCM10028922]|uniref:hypothetical protein n=1 Tax=Terrabacter sp. GCM10028922 TaxID=3273428 RepID=UPI003610A00A
MTHPEACAYGEYAQVRNWTSVAEFCESSWDAGVHVIALPDGRHLDVQIGGDAAQLAGTRGRALPVFFSGAVVPRTGKTGPFFSGSGIAERLSSPFIAVSDPVVDESSELPLGWYTGRARQGLQNIIVHILHTAQDRFGELVLIGGSGGGFASILFADRLGASAFVWNPQTDLLKYAPPVVRQYVGAAMELNADEVLDADYGQRSELLEGSGIQHLVTTPRGPGLRRLAYLQSASDWHVGVHATPFLRERGLTYRAKGVWSDGAGRAMLLANFSSGHTPPPYQAILRGIELFLIPEGTAGDVLLSLQHQGLLPNVDEDNAPRDLVDDRSTIEANLRLVVTEDGPSKQLRLDWGNLPKGFGGITATFRASDGEILFPTDKDPYATSLDRVDTPHHTLSATVVDGLGQQLCNLRPTQ